MFSAVAKNTNRPIIVARYRCCLALIFYNISAVTTVTTHVHEVVKVTGGGLVYWLASLVVPAKLTNIGSG